ncbi:hypothetical protein DFH06DRAFT_1326842 [Mycena polygramma]|nr:hypothetical protein DFH06DRAFT_1326842 [Mycena polygramma]
MAPAVCDMSADTPPFDPAVWIGKNKKFPAKDTKFEVHDALANVLKLPATFASPIPGPNLPIAAFLKLSFPAQSPALVLRKPDSWFSKDPPTTSVDCLLNRPIPSSEFLADFEKVVGQAWLDGNTSILDPRYNDGRDRLPLGALTLWKELARVVDGQKIWRKSDGWLTSELGKSGLDREDREALMTAKSLLDTLGWDTKIRGSWTTSTLAIILSGAWLSDDHIDMMMADLSARVAADPELAAEILIAPLAFSEAIKKGAGKATYTPQETPLLSRYEEHIKKIVDFKLGLIGTGDSRVKWSPPPTKFINALKRWGKKRFGRTFVYQGDSLEHGEQRDSSSCAVVTRNTIAAGGLGEAVWEQEHAAGARATCFVRLVGSAAIRKMVPVIPKSQPVLTAETPAEVSIAVALGDHNFPDLAAFALDRPRQSRPTLADLMNPAPGVAEASEPPEDVDIPDAAALDVYIGDHGDIDVEGGDEVGSHDEDLEKDAMDVDEQAPAARKGILSYFGVKEKASTSTSGKRNRDDVDSDLDESVDIDPTASAKKLKKANGTGTSKSAASAKKTRDARKSGQLTVATADPKRYAKWKATLKNGKNGNGTYADPKVQFHATDVKKALHSLCGMWVTMGEAYEAGRWNQHFKSGCSALHAGKKKKIGDGLGGVPTLQGMGWGAKKSSDKKPSRPTLPCPGITSGICPRLPIYLRRTGASGGGSRSVTAIARALFGKLALFRRLDGADKEEVANTQRHERQWINDHAKQRVFSTCCKKQVLAAGLDGSRTLPCSECSLVLGNRRFKAALRLPIPADEDYIYLTAICGT